MKLAKQRSKLIKVPIDPIIPIAAGPIDGPRPLDGPPIEPTYEMIWSIPIVEEKFKIVFHWAESRDISKFYKCFQLIIIIPSR